VSGSRSSSAGESGVKALGGSQHHSVPARPGADLQPLGEAARGEHRSAQREFGGGRQVRAGGAVRCGARPATQGVRNTSGYHTARADRASRRRAVFRGRRGPWPRPHGSTRMSFAGRAQGRSIAAPAPRSGFALTGLSPLAGLAEGLSRTNCCT
jgi:hypothetical protein